MTELGRRLGPDVDRWKYGQAARNQSTLEHPLSGAVGPELAAYSP